MKRDDLVQETRHKTPRRKLRRIGYDLKQWLEDGWETFRGSKADLERYILLFQDIEIGQSDPNTVDNLTEAQRVAYENYSGIVRLGTVPHNHSCAPFFGFRRQGSRGIHKKDLQEYCKDSSKLIRYAKDPDTGAVTDNASLYDIPPEFFYRSKTPIDPWELCIHRKMMAAYGDFKKLLRVLGPSIAAFLLIDMEKCIIQAEQGQRYSSVTRERMVYSKMWQAFFAEKHAQLIYTLAKANHPDVPPFNSDGTHS